MKKTQVVRLVADDNGYADHKMAYLNQAGKIECKKFPTSIQMGGSSLTSVDGGRANTYQVVAGADEGSERVTGTYTCSAAVTNPLDLRNSQYPFAEANRVLLHHAMNHCGLTGETVKVGLTLPFGDFYKPDGTTNESLQQKSVENFKQSNVVTEKEGGRVTIASAHVFPEGLCAFYDWGMHDDASVTVDYEDLDNNDASMLIVDIGGSTTDIVCLRMVGGDLMIDHAHSGTAKLGVLDVKEQINLEFQKKFGADGHESALSPRAQAKILETGAHRGGGQTYDLKAEVEVAIRAVSQQVVNFVLSKAGKINTFQAVHFVGGGAVVFGSALKAAIEFATFGDEFSNARGMLKYMIAQQQE